MSLDPISAAFDLGGKILDKFVADPKAKEEAKLAMFNAQQSGELEGIKTQLSVLISDSQSADPWTSRARPSFLYVVYTLLLWSIPMGVLYMFSPEHGATFILGFKGWLSAIPDSILQLFGVVMTGYVAGRSWEKVKGVSK